VSELRALLVTPLSGPLTRFGQPGATALRLWAEGAADLPPRWRRVRLDVQDAHPDSAAAMRRGLAAQPHLVFGPYGSGPALQALGATEHAVWNHGGASSAIRWPAFPRAVNVLAPSSSYFQGTLEAVRRADPEARRVVILHGTTGFGADVARGAAEAATRLHFEATAIGFAAGGAGRAASQLRGADVLLVAGGFDDELAAARVALGRGWRAMGFVAAGVDEVLASLGEAREGLLGPAQWIATAAPEPDEGPDVHWFATRYRSAVGNDPPYPAVQAFAAGVLAARCLRDAEAGDDAAQFAAARSLRCRTLYGEFRLDPVTGLQVGHQVLTVQWQGGERRVVWPPRHADRTLVYPRSQG
jgi:branched-chain amino acid transport system substrate-binding protein